jgi:hypothetical protein
MKSYIFFLAAGLLVLSACTTQYQAKNYDDVYYSAKGKQADDRSFVVKPTKVEPSQFTQSEQPQQAQSGQGNSVAVDSSYTGNSGGDTYVENNYNGDDYYDYAYSARLRRFHDNSFYNGYYSDYYTNSYWYDYNPWNWGVSIYTGYDWWYPSIYSRWSWPYNSWGYGYNGWWDPFPSYGWGSYAYGYNQGYWNGYYDGYWNSNWEGNGHYYNSYDDNSHYYSRRHTVGSSGSVAHDLRNQSFAERYENSLASGRNGNSRNDETIQAGRGSLAGSQTGSSIGNSRGDNNSGNGNVRNSGVINSGNSRSDGRTNQEPAPGNSREIARNSETGISNTTASESQNDRNAQQGGITNTSTQRPMRYTYQGTRNENRTQSPQNVRNQGNVQPYSSPVYSKPRSGQEYTAPKYRNSNPSNEYQNVNRGSNPNGGSQSPTRQGNNTYSNPSNNSRNTQPARGNSYSNPQRTYENRSAPARSTYSTPGRSNEQSTPRNNNSYSAPSRSSESSSPARSSNSNSYSAPSRSSESSSPSRSSGSSGSGSGSSGSGSGRRR